MALASFFKGGIHTLTGLVLSFAGNDAGICTGGAQTSKREWCNSSYANRFALANPLAL